MRAMSYAVVRPMRTMRAASSTVRKSGGVADESVKSFCDVLTTALPPRPTSVGAQSGATTAAISRSSRQDTPDHTLDRRRQSSTEVNFAEAQHTFGGSPPRVQILASLVVRCGSAREATRLRWPRPGQSRSRARCSASLRSPGRGRRASRPAPRSNPSPDRRSP